jgi:hypothetical protein
MRIYNLFIINFIIILSSFGFSQGVKTWNALDPITIDNSGMQSIPLKITPTYIAVPPKIKHLITGLPVKLYDFPVLTLDPTFNNYIGSWLELDIDEKVNGHNELRSKIKLGDPKFFPEYLVKKFDLKADVIIPRTKIYQGLRTLKLGRDENWHYVEIGSIVRQITNGIAKVSFPAGGALVFQKSFAYLNLAHTPILRYECELPENASLEVQVNAKISKNNFTTRVTPVFSSIVRGGGKQSLVVNFLELAKKIDPDIAEGGLEEIYIQFRSNSNFNIPTQTVDIQLGSLEFYRTTILKNNLREILIPVGKFSGQVDLIDKLSNELFSINEPILYSAKYMGSISDSNLKEIPNLTIQADHNFNVPELFVRDKNFLTYLNEQEYEDLLLQKLFLEPQVVWSYPQFKNNTQVKTKSDTVVTFPVNIKLEGDHYLKLSNITGDKPESVILSGLDEQNHISHFIIDMNVNNLIKLQPMQVKKISVNYRQENILGPHSQPYELPAPIEIVKLNKTKIYKPNKSFTQFKLDERELDAIWRTTAQTLNVNLTSHEGFHLLKEYKVDTYLVEGTKLAYDFISAGDTIAEKQVQYFIKLKGTDGSEKFEKLIQIETKGTITLPKFYLNTFEVLAKTSILPISTDVYFKDISIQKELKFDTTLSYQDIINVGKSIEVPKIDIQKNNQIIEFHIEGNESQKVIVDQFQLNKKYSELHLQNRGLTDNRPISENFLFKIFKLLIACIIIYLVAKSVNKGLTPKIDKTLRITTVFWLLEAILFPLSLFKMLRGTTSTEFSIGAIIFTVFYCIALRYKLRPYLAKRWIFFKERVSAPYFIIALVFLFVCATSLSLGQNTAAEKVGALVYYFLIVGITVEFISFTMSVETTKKDKAR